MAQDIPTRHDARGRQRALKYASRHASSLLPFGFSSSSSSSAPPPPPAADDDDDGDDDDDDDDDDDYDYDDQR